MSANSEPRRRRRIPNVFEAPHPRFAYLEGLGLALLVIGFCVAVIAGAPLFAATPSVLVEYSFDDQLTDTGPDTFAIFQNAKGHVRLVSQIRYSGYRSIELRDVAGDGDFPELQGYFPERKDGELFFHFEMLMATPDEQMNIALAGPSWFSVTKDGIAFWLKTINGTLHHVSDSIPKKLFKVDPFVWYVVDVRYDIPKGTYDLTIRRERTAEPIVALKDQPNSSNARGSSVDKFSFVGSVFEDDSNVTYYVDDVVIGTDAKVMLEKFVAPGRRKLFIDRWKESNKTAGCPPAVSFEDFGSEEAQKDWKSACAQGDMKQLVALAKKYPKAPIFQLIQDDKNPYFEYLADGEFTRAARYAEKKDWPERVGDALFLAGTPQLARRYYEEALKRDPNAYWPTVKLSDIFFLLGDSANEKAYRQKMYGRLEE